MNQLMQDVIDQINLKPQSWDQSSWVTLNDNLCGTSCCVAGWAMLKSGQVQEHIIYAEDVYGHKYIDDVQLIWPGVLDEDGDPRQVNEYEYKIIGARLLDLTMNQADQIFMFTNTSDPQVMTNHIKAVLDNAMDHDMDGVCTC